MKPDPGTLAAFQQARAYIHRRANGTGRPDHTGIDTAEVERLTGLRYGALHRFIADVQDEAHLLGRKPTRGGRAYAKLAAATP